MSYQTPIHQLWSWNTIFGKQSYEEFLLSTQKPKERELIPFFQEEELEPIQLEEQVISEKSITPPNWIKRCQFVYSNILWQNHIHLLEQNSFHVSI